MYQKRCMECRACKFAIFREYLCVRKIFRQLFCELFLSFASRCCRAQSKRIILRKIKFEIKWISLVQEWKETIVKDELRWHGGFKARHSHVLLSRYASSLLVPYFAARAYECLDRQPSRFINIVGKDDNIQLYCIMAGSGGCEICTVRGGLVCYQTRFVPFPYVLRYLPGQELQLDRTTGPWE